MRSSDASASATMSSSGGPTPMLEQQLRLLRRLGAKVTITFGDDDGEV